MFSPFAGFLNTLSLSDKEVDVGTIARAKYPTDSKQPGFRQASPLARFLF